MTAVVNQIRPRLVPTPSLLWTLMHQFHELCFLGLWLVVTGRLGDSCGRGGGRVDFDCIWDTLNVGLSTPGKKHSEANVDKRLTATSETSSASALTKIPAAARTSSCHVLPVASTSVTSSNDLEGLYLGLMPAVTVQYDYSTFFNLW